MSVGRLFYRVFKYLDMKNLIQEKYVFWRFAIQDFHECSDTLALMQHTNNNGIKMALFKAAVIAYCRPFSGNEASFKDQKWKIDENWVHDKDLHQRMKDLRSKLFAHSDIPFRGPTLGKIGEINSISMKGFYFETAMDFVQPLDCLSKSMLARLIDETTKYEQKDL